MAKLYHEDLQRVLVNTAYGQQVLNFAWHHAIREWAMHYDVNWIEVIESVDTPYYEFPNHLDAIRLKLQWNAQFVERWWDKHLTRQHEDKINPI